MVYNPKTGRFKTDSIRAFLKHHKQNRSMLERIAAQHPDPFTAKILREQPINLDIVDTWLAEQSATKEQGLSYLKWTNPRLLIFPMPHELEQLLQNTLIGLKISPYSALLKAAIMWYEIVRAHPWFDANKRSGKLIASIILLQNGYLPPLMTQEDAQKYTDLLKYGFQSADGHIAFVEFIAQLVDRTQHNPEILKQLGIATP